MVSEQTRGELPIATPAASPATRRLLAVCCLLLWGFAVLLLAATLVGERLRQPLDRIPAATYAAQQGIALSPDPATLPGTRIGAGGGAAATTAARRSVTPPVSATPEPGATAGGDQSRVAEVRVAYLHAWEVWAEACLTLDPAPLEGVFAQPELDRARSYVRQLRASGRALRLDAAHRVTVLELDGDTALVLDELTDRSVYVDPTTRLPLPPGAQPTPAGTERLQCRLQRTETGWRVVDITWGR